MKKQSDKIKQRNKSEVLGYFMKYAIDKELKHIARLKLPENLRAFPMMNRFLAFSKCRSDQKVRVKSCKTPGYDGAELKTLVIEPVQPAHSEQKLPCMVFFHGGGFMLRASNAHYAIAKRYAQLVPCKVIYTDYRLAPKFQFPVPAEDCFQTYVWTLDHAAMLGINPNKILIAGDSAGGNLALAVTLMARDRGIRMPDGELLIYPATDRRMTTESMKKYVDTPIWNAHLSKIMWKAYLGESEELGALSEQGEQQSERPGMPERPGRPKKIEYASPIEAESFEDFPPTYIEVAQYDALRDEGIALYNKMQAQNIECELHEISGACHGFETALKSNMLRECMNRRIAWLKNITNS